MCLDLLGVAVAAWEVGVEMLLDIARALDPEAEDLEMVPRDLEFHSPRRGQDL